MPHLGQCDPVHTSRSCPQPHTGGDVRQAAVVTTPVEAHACFSVVILVTAFPSFR